MATLPISEVPEVEQHVLAQAAIVAGLTASADELWPVLDPTDLAKTVPVIQRGLAALVDQFSQASISISADYYEDLRALYVSGRFGVPILDPPSDARIRAALTAISSRGLSQAEGLKDDLFLGQVTVELINGTKVAAQSLVANAGSDQVFAALRSDDKAQGWARITRPGACYFCRMLASRGAVYLTERTGSFRAHEPKNGRGGYCGCTVEPQFTRNYEPTAQAREDIATWNRVARGRPGPEAIAAFRREVEGRSDGPRRPRGSTQRSASETPPERTENAFDAMTPAQLRHQLEVIEPLKDSEWRTRQLDRLRSRLAELSP